MRRRLAAILVADVAGYSRSMGAYEAGTLRRLKSVIEDQIRPLVAEHHGRVVKLTGDGILVEFASVVSAVQCAVAWQKTLSQRDDPEICPAPLRFRIGINLGNVMVDGDDIFGDGVNVAARLEGLADPGGIRLSAKVYEEVKGKLALQYEDLGAKSVKNITDPIRVYRIVPGSPTETCLNPSASERMATIPEGSKPFIAVLPPASDMSPTSVSYSGTTTARPWWSGRRARSSNARRGDQNGT